MKASTYVEYLGPTEHYWEARLRVSEGQTVVTSGVADSDRDAQLESEEAARALERVWIPRKPN